MANTSLVCCSVSYGGKCFITSAPQVGNDNGDEDDDVGSDDGKSGSGDQDQRTRAIVSAETAAILSGLGKGPLDVRWGMSFIKTTLNNDAYQKVTAQ